MQLKEYQQGVLNKLDRYLAILAEKREKMELAAKALRDAGVEVTLPDYCVETWNTLNEDGALPSLVQNGLPMAAPYLTRFDALKRPIPSICLKVPTVGGKTLLATAAVERIQADYFKRQTGMVLWVVPSDAIYRQTWKHLANREHPYRQMLERASGGRVKMLEKLDSFGKRDVEASLCVMLLMLPSASRQSKETLRMFRDSGRYPDFFPVEDDHEANVALLKAVPNLDVNDLADMGYAEGVVPGSVSVKMSLGNVLRLVRPVVVIDEGHRAYSETARGTLCGFNPRFMLELSATPNTDARHLSNVLVNVPGADLKDEEMIKLPIEVTNEARGGWKQTLTAAHAKREELAKEAVAFQHETNRYIRPIVLVRVERTGKEQRDSAFVHAEDAREYLRDSLGVHEDEIRLKTSESDELGDEDLLADTCPVTYIITKDALREGWDCPFAYVLAILSKTTANTALTQMVGRILRQPHAALTGHEALDSCYVLTFDVEVMDAVNSVRKGLQEEGMADIASYVKPVNPGSGTPKNTRRETLSRRDRFKGLPPIFLPRVLAKDEKEPDGYRPLDHERDLLGELDWDQFNFREAGNLSLDEEGTHKRTTIRATIGKGEDAVPWEMQERTVDEVPTEGLDKPFLVRQLLDTIPNPWQGIRLLDEALDELRKVGVDEKVIYVNRLNLVNAMKSSLQRQVNAASERLFHEKLNSGRIALKLVASTNADLNWHLAETLELEVSEEDRELWRPGGRIEKNLFEKVYQREFNDLERHTAVYLDSSESVYWWHRIAVGRGSYALQGWQRNRVYPDMLACVHADAEGRYRFTVLESKRQKYPMVNIRLLVRTVSPVT